MQSITVVFDAQKYSVQDMARMEEEIWTGLKLSGELNRAKRDGNWLLHYTCEKDIKEDSLKKIPALELAQEVRMRDLTEAGRSRKKAKESDAAADFAMDEPAGEEDED